MCAYVQTSPAYEIKLRNGRENQIGYNQLAGGSSTRSSCLLDAKLPLSVGLVLYNVDANNSSFTAKSPRPLRLCSKVALRKKFPESKYRRFNSILKAERPHVNSDQIISHAQSNSLPLRMLRRCVSFPLLSSI